MVRLGEYARGAGVNQIARRVEKAMRTIKQSKGGRRGRKTSARGWRLAAAAIAPVLAAGSLPAVAAVRTWDGGGADDNLTTAANWVGNVAPVFNAANNVAGDDWIFTGTTRLAPVNNSTNLVQTAFTITFDANAGAFNLGGPNAIVVGTTGAGGHITNNGTNVQTFSGEVRSRVGTITSNGGDLVFAGIYNVGNDSAIDNRTNTFTGSGNIIMSGQVVGFGRLLKEGSGTLHLTNTTNDFLGGLRVNNGAVRVSAPGAFGNGTGRTTVIGGNVANTGRLELVGGHVFNPEAITLEARQFASANAPHIVNVSGNNELTGPISLTTGGFEYTIHSNADLLKISGPIQSALTGLRQLHFGGPSNGEVTGSIGVGMSIVKDGTGTWTLSGANGYSGTVTVNAGTLVLNGQQSTGSPVIINNGGTLKLTVNGQMNNATNVLVNGGGTLDVSDWASVGGYTLPLGNKTTGNGTIRGPINVGQLANLAPGVGPVPGTLRIEGNVAYTGGGSATLTFAPGASSLIDIQGDLTTSTANGANSVDILGHGMTVGTHDLIKYSGALGGEGFSGFTLGALPPRLVATLVNDTAGKSIDLNVTGVDFPRWIGNVSSDWDINTSQNWREVNSGNGTTYLQPGTIGDAVLFDDQGANPVVNLVQLVSPAAVTFNNNTVNYVVGGGGAISGPGQLIKDGTGTAVLANFGINDYAGGTFIKNGILQLGDDTNQQGGSLGAAPVTIDANGTLVFKRLDNFDFANKLIGTGDVIKRGVGVTSLTSTESFDFGGEFIIEEGVLRIATRLAGGNNIAPIRVRPGGTLDVSAQQMGPKPIFFEGTGHNNQGAIISTGNQNNALEDVTMTGDATVGGTGRFDIRNLGNPVTRLSTGGNAYNLTKIGSAQFSLVGVTVDPALGDINVNEGTFSVESSTTGLGNPSRTINLGSAATLQFWALATPVDKNLISAGGTIASGSGTMNAFLGPVTLNADTFFRNEANTALTLTDPISGAGGLIKGTQAGSLVLGSVNTYAGRTEIGGGAITVISLGNGGQPSGIGQSASDATNLVLGGGTSTAGRLNFVGSNAATTDRLFTVNGTGATLDASGAAGAPLVFANAGAVVMNNSVTSVANVTLTGSNRDDNVLAPSISNGINGATSPVGLVKSGAGTWVLAGNNTFSGVVSNSNGGILKIRSNTALGDTTGDTLLADNTANPNPTSLWLDHPTGLTVAENFRTTGGGGGGENPLGPGVIRSVRGNNVLSGTLTLQAGGGMSTYTVDTGSTLDFSGTLQNIAGTSRIAHLGGAGDGRISGVIQNNQGTNNGTATMGVNKVGAGTWTIAGTSNTYTGPTSVGGGVLRVTGSVATSNGVTANNGGTFDAAVTQTVNALTVNDGGKALVSRLAGATSATVLTTKALTIGTNTAQVDLASNAMIVDYAAGSSPLANVRSAVTSGYAGGAWTGPGIVSSTAATNPNGAVGYAEASDVIGPAGGDFMGRTVDADAVLTRYTLGGDATLNGEVNFDDLARLAQNYNVLDGQRLWSEGDFNYDGDVDFDDLAKMAQNYNTSLPAAAEIAALGGGASFGEDVARAFAQVPEPGSMTLLAITAGAMVGRRRRR